MTDAFRVALEAALAAKAPEITDELRAKAIKLLIVQAMDDDPEAKKQLLGVAAASGSENPDATVDGWLEDARQHLRDICASVNGPVTRLVVESNTDPAQTFPAQHWRGPLDPELSPREPAAEPLEPPPMPVMLTMGTGEQIAADAAREAEEAAAQARSKIEAERYERQRQSVYESALDRATKWLKW